MKKYIKFSATAVLFYITTSPLLQASAFDADKCHKVTNKGWWRQYHYIPPTGFKTATENTKRDGYTSSSTKGTTENSTAVTDPGVSSAQTQSQAQYTSSRGECSFIGSNELKKERATFVAINLDQIKKEAAAGGGSHIQTLADLSLCDQEGAAQLSIEMQKNLSKFIDLDAAQATETLNQIRSSGSLRKHCTARS